MQNFSEKKIHQFFWVTLLLKGAHSLFEVIGGLFLLFVSQESIIHFVQSITQDELTEDPSAIVAHYLVQTSTHLTQSGQAFAAWYLLSHGLVKGILVIGLIKEKLWVYPIANVVFAIFAVYQILRFTHTHSPLLLLLTALDAVVIGLTWHEYRYKKKLLKKGGFL